MSIASRIQEIETHIGNAYTSIDNLGIDISNTNKNIYNISALLDTFYESLPKVSGIGSSLSLSPTMVGKIKLNEIQGDTQQDSYTGKNLYNSNYRNASSSIDFVRCTGSESNGVYTMTATESDMYFWYVVSSGNSYSSTCGPLFEFKENTYTMTITNTLFKNNYVTFYDENQVSLGYVSKNSNTFTINKSEKTGAKYFTIRIGYGSATSGTTYTTSVQLEQGSSASTYEKYVGGAPSPNPDYPQAINTVTGRQNINVCGKNLFNANNNTYKDIWVTHTIDNTNKITVTNSYSWARLETTIKNLKPNTNYTISTDITNASGLNCGLWGARDLSNLSTNTNFKSSITKQSDSSGNLEFYFYVNYSGTTTSTGTVTFDTIQIEENTQATSYEPYKGNTYEVNLGKNLLDTSKFTSTTQATSINSNSSEIDLITNNYGNFITIFDNLGIQKGNYTIWCEVVSGTYTGGNLCFFDLNGTQYSTEFNFKNDSTHIKQINLTNGLNKLRIYSPKCESDTKIKIWLIKGNYTSNTIPSFSPYFEPIELNKIGDYQDSIKKSTGKNLFDKNAVTRNKIINRDSGTTSTISNYAATDFIPIGENVTFTCTDFNVWYTACYDKNKNYIGYMENKNTMTTLPNTSYIRASILLTNLDSDKGQIELGTQQTSYEPYGKVWYVEKKIGKVVLDGSESWTDGSTNIFNVEDILPPHTYSTYSVNVLCDSYLGIIGYGSNSAFVSGTTNIDYACSLHSNGTTIRFKDIRYTSKEDLKTWLGTHNATLYFQLATPTYTEITNTELINQLESIRSQDGTTNISITSENLPMIINASALKGED